MNLRTIPFGYKVVDGKYVANDSEVEVISSIYNMYLSGTTLLGIANALTEQGITYFENHKVWNKNMVSRILLDERYLGNDSFPQLVDSDNFNLAKNIRAGKGGKKAVLSPLISVVKDKLYCAECGQQFNRINKWGSKEKWLCKGKCKCSVYLDDKTICDGILSVVNMAIRDPRYLVVSKKTDDGVYSQSIEVIRKRNALNRYLEQNELDFGRILDLIIDCASERYKCCELKSANDLIDELYSEYEQLTEQSELDESLMKRTIEKVTVSSTGLFRVHFIGGVSLSSEI